MLRRLFLFLSVFAVLTIAAGPAMAVQYTITDLGTVYSGTRSSASVANSVNNHGQVAGYGTNENGQSIAFYWADGTLTELGSVGGGASCGYGINDAGVVVGNSDGTAMIWDSTNGMSYLNGAPSMSQCTAINDNLNVKAVGYGYFTGQQGFIYDVASGSLTELTTTLGGPLMTEVTDINNDNELVGKMYLDGAWVFFRYDGSTVTDLSTLITGVSSAQAINNDGWIVGKASTANFASGAYLFNGTTSVDLGFLNGRGVEPYDVSNNGLVVGNSQSGYDPATGPIPAKAFLYDNATSTMSDLYTLLDTAGMAAWTSLDRAYSVNNAGQIVGSGKLSTGELRAFLMTPVPEPSTVALAALGLVGLLCYAWRKRK